MGSYVRSPLRHRVHPLYRASDPHMLCPWCGLLISCCTQWVSQITSAESFVHRSSVTVLKVPYFEYRENVDSANENQRAVYAYI